MTTIYMRRVGNALVPDCDEEADKIKRLKTGKVIKCEISEMRNGAFHRKYWSLIGVAFDYWSANAIPRQHNGMDVRLCKEVFQKDLMLLCGYSTPVASVLNGLTYMPDSISFAKMTEETFEKLYSDTIDVILQKVLPNLSEEDLNEAMERTLAYA